jgi:hypothetical protein
MAHHIDYFEFLESDPNLKFPFVEKGEVKWHHLESSKWWGMREGRKISHCIVSFPDGRTISILGGENVLGGDGIETWEICTLDGYSQWETGTAFLYLKWEDILYFINDILFERDGTDKQKFDCSDVL